jgi:Flp pilus assembly pilin Flp
VRHPIIIIPGGATTALGTSREGQAARWRLPAARLERMQRPPSENHLMDKLRATATTFAGWVAGSRPTVLWRVSSEDDQRGQGLAEYALILALIAIVAIVSLAFLGNTITDLFWAPIDEEFGKILSRLGI